MDMMTNTMTALVMAMAVLVSACAADTSALVQDSVITPKWDRAPDASAAQLWADEVQAAIDAWQLVLGDCRFPLFVGPSGPTVSLIAVADWTEGQKVGGMFHAADGTLDIKGEAPGWGSTMAALSHELGHAIGLDHSPDSSSIMHFSVRDSMRPTDADGLVARTALGCE